MADVKSILASEMGAPKKTVTVKRDTFVSAASGDLRVTFGTIAWPNEDRTALQEATPILEGTVNKYLNEKGYKVPFSIGSTHDDVRKLADALTEIADLMEKYDVVISQDSRQVTNVSAADAFFSKKKK
jgi:hypothetical protein